MKILKILLFMIILILGILVFALYSVKVDFEESELPVNVYEEQADLLSIVDAKLFELFMTSVTDEFTVIEEVLNLVVLNSIRDNVNAEYDPLGDCETIECNFIIHEDYYYLNYIIVELTENDQFLVKVSLGSDKYLEYNTVFSFLFDVEINYTGFEISLTLDQYHLSDKELSMSILDTIFSNLDAETIETQVSTGDLDLEEYSYSISFSPFS
jgi:hypothetical protein